jgi:CHAT domain-containing protein
MLAPFQRSPSAFLGSALLLLLAFIAPAQAQLPDSSGEIGKLEARILELWGAGRIAETLPLRKRVVELSSRTLGPEHPQTIQRAEDLGYVYVTVGRPDEAKPLFDRVIRFKETAVSRKRDATTAEILQLGQLYKLAERYSEAETLYRRTLATKERAGGPMQKEVADILFLHLGPLYSSQGRHAEEEAAYKRALAIQEKIQGSDPLSRITTVGIVGMLTGVYEHLGRNEDAEAFAKRYVASVEREPTLGDLAFGLSELAKIHNVRGRHAEAEVLYKRALAAEERNKTSGDRLFLGHYLNSLSDLYYRQRRYAEAEQLAKRAVPLVAHVGETSWNAPSLTLARVQQAQGRHAEAEITYRRVLANFERQYGGESSAVAPVLADLAGLKQVEGNLPEAYELAKRATAALVRQVRTRSQTLTMAPGGQLRPTRLFHQPTFAAHLRAAAELASRSPDRAQALAAEGFEIAQWAQHSHAAAALSQMAARFAKGEGELARLVRERQDLVGRYRILDRKLTAALAKPAPERHRPQEETWRKDMGEVEKRISAIDTMLSQKFPDYAALASPEPLSVRDTQALLRPGEALYQLVLDDDRSFAWVVTRDAVRWQAVAHGRKALADHVEALRCGLDATVWEASRSAKSVTAATSARASTPHERCRQLLGAEANDPAALPFDLVRAHALYAALFSPFEDIIKDKHLLIVPAGALTPLPLQVLVTAAPSASLAGDQQYVKAAWLASRQPLTVLPSAASLKSLRGSARKSMAQSPYAGFGNPLLSGPSGTDRSAWSRQACAAALLPAAGQQVAAVPGARSNVQDFFRGGRVDVALIRRQQPLPETADELCAVAAALGASPDVVFLGSRATEGTLKSLNTKGLLKSWRVLHFATHGLVAGETQQIAANQAEPALMLTPPDTPSEEDDGLLTASEIAQLELDADWVLLSACNTASGDGAPEAEALSGLTRAFLYAGSRALVVSHWPVNSEAAVRLVTGTFAELKRSASIGRAEALRRAMLAQIKEGGYRGHPSYWAPFVIVGEGG